MKNLHLVLASCSVVLLAAGCGGGGSSSGGGGTTIPTAAVQITPTNAQAVAKGAATPAQGMAKSGSKVTSVVGAVASTSGHSRSILDISLAEFKRIRNLHLTPAVVGAVQTMNCTTSGTMAFDYVDAAPAGMGLGDSITMTFSNCVEPTGTSNGTMSFSIGSFSGGVVDPVTGNTVGTVGSPIVAGFTMTFNNFTSVDSATGENMSMNGDMGFSFSDNGDTTSGTMSGNSISMTSSIDGAFQMSGYSMTFSDTISTGAYSFIINMTTASVVANGSITITTPTAFTGTGNGDPTAGVMVITGANNSTLTLTAQPDGVQVQMVVDEDGAAGPIAPVTLTQTTWAAI
ncbi:MAG: hypothetical protein HY938_11230 [Nitrosomonadales bacterium]|nr:hypothetical protein [Nitrosomonadales bacterium]